MSAEVGLFGLPNFRGVGNGLEVIRLQGRKGGDDSVGSCSCCVSLVVFGSSGPDFGSILNGLFQVNWAGRRWQSVEGSSSGVSCVVSGAGGSHFGSLQDGTTVDGARQQQFFFNDTPTAEIYTLSLHDALPI